MISRKCCCTTSNTCCDPILKDQFVTLFDTELDSACPVSDQDLMVLKINRPGAQAHGREWAISTSTASCGPCCRTCSTEGCLCGPLNDNPFTPGFDMGNLYDHQDAGCTPCCCGAPAKYGGCEDSCACRFVNNWITCGCPGQRDCPNGILPEQPPNNVPSVFKTFVNKVFKNPLPYSEKNKITSLNYLSGVDKNTNNTLKKNEKQLLTKEITGNFKNTRFKTALEFLSRCKKCLQDNNIDIDCVDNDTDITCRNKNTNICENCYDECVDFCDPSYGGTRQQITNSELLLSNVNYTDNILALDPELDTNEVYSGSKDVSNLVKSLGSGDYGNGVTVPPDPPLCSKCSYGSGNPAAPPIYFIYRYSSCNFIWYPPEYVFNYNRTPSQCPGYINPKGIKTCDYFFGRVNNPDGAESELELTCGQSVFDNEDVTCSRDSNTFPCQCINFPHLSGGLYDTLQRRINVSKRQFFGGYIAGKNPFLPKVKISELGCCTCFTTQGTGFNDASCALEKVRFDTKRSKFLSYPKASGWGSSIQAIGIGCTEDRGISPPGYNPRYELSCFSRGISPYLSRISISLYTLAFDIFHYGSDNPTQQETLGATYRSSSILEDGKKWTALRFTKMYNKKDSLYNKLVGIVSLEHHFESWAYHSKAPFSPQPPLLMNHGLILLIPYERPYAGTISNCSFRWDTRAAMRWQIQHYTPRTVMYGSSGIPIFFSDIYAFEHLSNEKNILIDGETFNGAKFLEQYYLYFYNNMIKPPSVNEPYVEPNDISMYDYVTTCLTEMIRYNIISVKDHAKDIADELIEILDQINIITVNGESVVVFPNNFIKTQIGGSAGYYSMITFLKRLVGSDAGNNPIPDWTALKPYITAKVIKRMINPNTMIDSDSLSNLNTFKKKLPGPMFLGPRRVKLIPTPISSGLTAWGCGSEVCASYNPNPLNIQPNIALSYSSVHTNDLGTNFAITVNGKVQITGNNSIPDCLTDTDSNNFISSLGCVPLHLSYRQDIQENPADMAGGSIQKISSKGKFAVALVNYEQYPLGIHIGNETSSNTNRKLDSNCGVQWVASGPFDQNYGGIYRQDPSFGFYGVYPNCPGYGYGINDNTFALKTWGPDNKYGVFYNPPGDLYYCPSSHDSNIAPQGNLTKMPLKNRYRLWVDVAAGAKHCVAITGDGCLFVTPESDNTHDQASYGRAPVVESGDPDLTYIENMPVPGYFKDIEWNGNSLLTWRQNHCLTQSSQPNLKCDIRCYLYSVNSYQDLDPNRDAIPFYYAGGITAPERPFYTKVGAGQYHSIAVSSDQNLKVWGSYVKINQFGAILGSNQQDITGNTGINKIPAFVPTNLISPDSWSLGGLTYGCLGEGEDKLVYTTANKTIASVNIFDVDGGPDYSLAVTGSNKPVNVIIWGHSEMVSALNNTAISGLTGSDTKSYDYIEKIIAGVNSFGVLHRRQNNAQKFLDIFTRPSRNSQGSYDFGVDKLPYTEYDFEDAALSYGHAIGIVNSGYRINTWKKSSFNRFTGHDLLQFYSTADLPLYFQSQAFFRCVKGHWDFSKWLFGRSCNQLGAQEQDNEVIQQDKCSIYWKKGEANLCYTGHPKYYWMKPNNRRYQQVTPLHTRSPSEDGSGCGLMRNEVGKDGMSQTNQYGTGVGSADQTTADLNSQLSGMIGGCYSGQGDICWMGDGSPSAFKYSPGQAQNSSGSRCDCEKPCGCPPESETYYRYDCNQQPYAGSQCFSDFMAGRAGFASNKDYFVQSHKFFGKSNKSPDGDGQCCGVIDTNITYFYYAKKCYYYGYNSITGLYEVKDAPLKYRSYYWGEGRTGAANQIIGATSAVYMNYTMTPEDCIVKYYQVDYYMQYPTVYVGGHHLKPLKTSFSSSVNLGVGSGCQDCYCNANDVCSSSNHGCINTCSGCKDRNAGANLLGPGGWLYNPGAVCRSANDNFPVYSGGYLSSSIALFDKTLYLEAGASTYLGPLVKFGPYTGSLPPGFTATCYTGPACPCPNYEAQCAGCNLRCNANAVYDVLEEYDIDDLTKYNLVKDDITYTQEQSAKLFRVYEELKSVWYVNGAPAGMTSDPIAFQGGWDLCTNGCADNPTTDPITGGQHADLDRFCGVIKYSGGITYMLGIASDLTCTALTD